MADTQAYTMSTITSAGTMTTLGGAITPNRNTYGGPFAGSPLSIVADSAGNAYVAEGNEIDKVTPAGVVSTFAGGFNAGSADGGGNLYVADYRNCTIHKITPAAVVSTVVGVAGQCGFVPGPLPATLTWPMNVALNGRTLYITTVNGVAVVNNVP